MGLAYDPFAHARELGLNISITPLKDDLSGAYSETERTIFLIPGMSGRERRSVLAHEIQHALAHDSPSAFGFVNFKQEKQADEKAALALIDEAEYRQAEEIHSAHIPTIAHALNVTEEVVETWLKIQTRLRENAS